MLETTTPPQSRHFAMHTFRMPLWQGRLHRSLTPENMAVFSMHLIMSLSETWLKEPMKPGLSPATAITEHLTKNDQSDYRSLMHGGADVIYPLVMTRPFDRQLLVSCSQYCQNRQTSGRLNNILSLTFDTYHCHLMESMQQQVRAFQLKM